MKFIIAALFIGVCAAFPQLQIQSDPVPQDLGPVFPPPQPAQPAHFQAPPAHEITFGVDANGCTVGPTGKVCPSGPVQFTSAARGKPEPFVPPPPRPHQQQAPAQHHNHGGAFVGLVGPSGVIGPSGLVGPAGPLAFGK